jgi:ankyrin repeat protein
MIAAGFGGQVRFAEYNPHSGTERDAADCVQLALEHGARLDAVTDTGQTVLHLAAAQRGVEFISVLLQRGADPAARDAQGRTPLDVAMGQGGGRGRPATARPDVAALLRRLSTDAEKK